MPIVWVMYDKEKLDINFYFGRITELRNELPKIVAKALDVPEVQEGRLTPDDIEVRFQEFGEYDKYMDLEIVIFANYFPEREKDLQNRRVPEIAKAVKEIIGEYVKGFVYVRLTPAGFAEF